LNKCMLPHNDYLGELKYVLRSPDVLAQLIHKGAGEFFFNNLKLHRIASLYSEPSLRASYVVERGNGIKFFFKINSYEQKIHNEVRAFKLISHYAVQEYRIPEILDFELGVAWGDAPTQTCSWIVEEWVDGQAVHPEDSSQIDLAAALLAQINNLEIDLGDVAALFAMPLPSREIIAAVSRNSIVVDLEKAVHLTKGSLQLDILRAIDVFTNNNIPFMLNLNHGDFHFNNLLLKNDSGILCPTIIDWEDINLENPLYDLAHFLFLAERSFGPSIIKAYFRNSHELYSIFSWSEIAEMVVAMYTLWISRNLRWKSKQINSSDHLDAYCANLNTYLSELRMLPWKSLLA
jgi:hypothetical protein